VSTWAIEVNDAGLQLVAPSGLRAVEPGYALIDADAIALGRAARAQCRLHPRQVCTEFWRDLSVEPLEDPSAGGRSSAELAALQLSALWALAAGDPGSTRALLVVPGEFDRARLSVLLGAAKAAGLPVDGLVDSAVAATLRCYPGFQLLHVDIGLHHVRLTQLSQNDGLRRSRFECLPELGLLALRERWLRAVADRFIAETRFDPLHDARSEQRLHDQLDLWLAEFRKADVLELALETAGGAQAIEVPRRELLATTDPLYQILVRWLGTRRAPGAPMVLQVGHRLAELPGVLEALERLEETVVVPCAETAPASGALARAEAIRRPAKGLALVVQLPVLEPPASLAPPLSRAARARSRATAHHLLHRGLAYPIGEGGFGLGTAEAPGGAGLRLTAPEPLAGISRRHCVLFYRDGELLLQDQSRYGTFVNELRVGGELALRPGDVIRVGTPGVELQVIALVDRDGA
jgi:hypothetical protein